MQPTSVEKISKENCSRCDDEGWTRSTPLIPNGTFDVPFPGQPRNSDETIATLVEESFVRNEQSQCDACGAPVRRITSKMLADPKEAVIINLGRFVDNPLWAKLALERQTGTSQPSTSRGRSARPSAARMAPLKQDRRVKLADKIKLPLMEAGNFAEYEIVSTVEHRGSTFSGKYCFRFALCFSHDIKRRCQTQYASVVKICNHP